MRKIVIHKPGGYEALQIENFPDPAPKSGQVLIETVAIGVNYADCCVRWGVYQSAKKYVGWPITPGFEFSGRVLAIGDGVTRFKKGDAVFGVTRFDAYSTHVVVPEHQIFLKPEKFSFEEAAAFPAVYMTAYHALFQNIRLHPGMDILVHSAAGGVGTALLQLGRLAKCNVVGVVGSTHKIQAAKDFGATHVIDKSKQDLWREAEKAAPNGYDVVLDANGPPTLRDGYNHLKPTGRLVTYGYHTMLPKGSGSGRLNYLKALWGLITLPRFNAADMCDSNKGIFGFNISFLFDRHELLTEGMEALLKWVADGTVKAPQVTSFKFEQVGEAHRRIETGQTTGKLVLVV